MRVVGARLAFQTAPRSQSRGGLAQSAQELAFQASDEQIVIVTQLPTDSADLDHLQGLLFMVFTDGGLQSPLEFCDVLIR